MSENLAIKLVGVGKMYKVFPSPFHNLMDALGMARLVPGYKDRYKEFWALRDINLELPRGHRVGIIGRNGAGKSTLLKLITGNLPPTEGEVEVHGRVDALLEPGAGFHPEFSGYENIRAALTYQGIRPAEIDQAIQEIEEFTELGQFLKQPFKTYSSGMQARLTFATATAIEPDILIIDEILGAGDGYFFNKSTERMTRLVEETGATVLIVSHSLDQIVRFCEEAIWLDRGKTVQRGPAMDVVKAYQEYLSVLNERRLKSKNKLIQEGRSGAAEFGYYSDNLVLTLEVTGPKGARLDVSEVALREYQETIDALHVGDAQDSSTSQSSYVLLDDSFQWSTPQRSRGHRFRSIAITEERLQPLGQIVFFLYLMHENLQYSLDITYRAEGVEKVKAVVARNGKTFLETELPIEVSRWKTHTIALEGAVVPSESRGEENQVHAAEQEKDHKKPAMLRRWQVDDSLTIDQVRLLGESGEEQALFAVGTSMTLRMSFVARKEGTFPVLPVAVIYRSDGVIVSQHWGERREFELHAGERREAELNFGQLNLGNGAYLVSVGIYRKLSIHNLDEAEPYQIIDRSYEFEVFGNPPRMSAVFRHPGEWRFL